jgi:hypothetical protein
MSVAVQEPAPMQPGEAGRLVADFLAARSITACPTRYAAPIEQRSRFSRHWF